MDTLKISNSGSYGVASTGTCLVQRLQRPFALAKELFKGFKGSSMAQEQSKKQEHRAAITESYSKLKRLFYWIVFDNPGIYLDEMKGTCEGLT